MRATVMVQKRHQQAGLSLIELMIAMVLGLLIISAVANMYLGATRSSQFTNGLLTMQENGRYGVSTLRRGLRLAGYSPTTRLDPVIVADSSSESVTISTVREYDCNGISTQFASTTGRAVNTYVFNAETNQITCRGDSPSASDMPVVDGVEAFRILYGLDQDGNDVPDHYVAYAADMPQRSIVGIRFALLVNSGNPIRTQEVAESHVVLDTVVETEDRFARHVFNSTVLLRNRL